MTGSAKPGLLKTFQVYKSKLAFYESGSRARRLF